MSNELNLLVTLSNGQYLLRCAVKTSPEKFTNFEPYYLEPDIKSQIANMLPDHVKSFGEIVEVSEIFEIKDLLTNK
jgi:hypothetical protein